jgi:vancomycin permeability regulator SanA
MKEMHLRETPEDMLDTHTGSAIQVDPRLLNKNDWTNRPRLIQALLDEAACCVEPSGLATLAASYLSLSSAEFQINRSGQTAACDVFIIPGHVLNADTTPKPELVARLEMALLASQRHPKAKLIVSGGGKATGAKEAAVMRHWLINKGVSDKSLNP